MKARLELQLIMMTVKWFFALLTNVSVKVKLYKTSGCLYNPEKVPENFVDSLMASFLKNVFSINFSVLSKTQHKS